MNTNADSDSGVDSRVGLTTDGAGKWLAVWDSTDALDDTVGSDFDVLRTQSTDAGATWTAPAPLNADATSDSSIDSSPEVATDGAGNWVTVWHSNNPLGETVGTDWDIFYATFSEIVWDYGDAPSPYATLLADAGAGTLPRARRWGPFATPRPTASPT